MTNEEAYELLFDSTICLDKSRYTREEAGLIFKAYKIALYSLEKQIPKKPKIEHRGTIPYSASCPECGAFLGYDFRNVLYCEMCGQALDWGGKA